MNMHKKKRFAISTTEMLLGLAIVGVIASLTLPGLIKGYKFKIYETAIKNFYSATKQAITLYMAHNTVTDLRSTNLYGTNNRDISSEDALDTINDFVMRYYKVAGVCDNSKQECFAQTYKTYDGEPMTPNFTTDTESDSKIDYLLMDGSAMRIGFTEEGPIEIFVDTNGPKNPNRAGYDLWSMNIYRDGSIDEVFVESTYTKTASQANNEKQEMAKQLYENECKGGSYRGCFGKLLQDGFNLNIDD